MGVPISEHVLSDILERFDSDHDGTIDFEEFETVMNELKPKPKEDERWSWGSLGEKIRKTIGSRPSDAERKLECAFPLLDIEKIESINVCCSEQTELFAKSSWSELMFAIFIKGRATPLLLVCSKPAHRLAWVDAFRICYVKSVQLKADGGSRVAKKIRSQVGWQHRIIRASLFSLVVCNDLTKLREQLAKPYLEMEIDEQDDYGYTALHYCALLGHFKCASLLVQQEANVNLKDDNQKTPLDLAALSGNKDMISLLEKHGGQKHASEVLFKSAIEEQKQLKDAKPSSVMKSMGRAKKAAGAMSEAMSALRERGEKLESLDNKTAQLHNDAANYADMAKQLKEKNKKKAKGFGL